MIVVETLSIEIKNLRFILFIYCLFSLRKCSKPSVANCNFVQIPSKLPKNPEISLKNPKFLLSFSCSQSRSAQFRPQASYCVFFASSSQARI